MRLNADFSQRAAVHAASAAWVPSPMPGVMRRLLHREGEEKARATSIVRYAAGSHFQAHSHPGGEEFLVLEGVFQDEHGDYPAGTYVRNPPGSRHTPRSDEGCTIFVKLWQFDPQDKVPTRTHLDKLGRMSDVWRPGVLVSPLFKDGGEDVRVEVWAANTQIDMALPLGGEFLVLDGGFADGAETFTTQSWLRLPRGSALKVRTGSRGTKVWMKLGHGAGSVESRDFD